VARQAGFGSPEIFRRHVDRGQRPRKKPRRPTPASWSGSLPFRLEKLLAILI